MSEELATQVGLMLASDAMLALVIAHTPSIPLDDTRSMSTRMVSLDLGRMFPTDEMKDHVRVAARDRVERVLTEAKDIREGLRGTPRS